MSEVQHEQAAKEFKKIAYILEGFKQLKHEADNLPLDSNVMKDLEEIAEIAEFFESNVGRAEKRLRDNPNQLLEKVEELGEDTDRVIIDLNNSLIFDAERLVDRNEYKPAAKLLVFYSRSLNNAEKVESIEFGIEGDIEKIEEELKQAQSGQVDSELIEKHLEKLKSETGKEVNKIIQNEFSEAVRDFKKAAKV
jgi:hypothetical protein